MDSEQQLVRQSDLANEKSDMNLFKVMHKRFAAFERADWIFFG